MTLLRHATLVIDDAGVRILVDPMLGDAHAPLPRQAEDALAQIDAAWVSQAAADHLDESGRCQLRNCGAIWAGRGALRRLVAEGVVEAVELTGASAFRGVQLLSLAEPTTGGSASLLLRARHEPTVMLAGDRPADAALVGALRRFRPDIVVISGGGPEGGCGFEATPSAAQMVPLFRAVPEATFIITHLEALEGPAETRRDVKARLDAAGLLYQAAIPADGETMRLTA